MPAIRTFASPSRTMHSAAAARIRLRASAAARSRWLGSLVTGSAMCAPSDESACRNLTVQSVSDARLAGMRRQGSEHRSLPQSGPGSATATGGALDALFDPGSITVVGASDDSAKWGHILSRRALESSGDRPVLLVNRRGAEVLGRRTHRTLAEARDHLGEPLDLVVVCVPAAELVADGRGRRRSGGSIPRGDHCRALRARRRRSPRGAGGGAPGPVGGRGAGRTELPRGGRHQHPAAAEPRRAAGRRRWRCSARAATWCSTSPPC